MTTFATHKQTCAVCAKEVECRVLSSSNQFGSPDLDLRPPEMMRSTMSVWLQECPECHYVSNDLESVDEYAKEIVKSAPYIAASQDESIPNLVKRFYLQSLLLVEPTEKSGSLLRAAWICDDMEDKDLALKFRNLYANAMAESLPFADEEEQVTPACVFVDVLRRSCRFDEATEMANILREFQAVQDNPTICNVLSYQRQLCEQKDSQVHTIEEAVGIDS